MSVSYLVSATSSIATRRISSLSFRGVSALTIRVLGAASLFLSHLVLVRSMGVTGFGEYAEAIAWLQTLCVLGKFGFDAATLRFVAEYTTRGELARLHGFLNAASRFGLFASLVSMIMLCATAQLYWNSSSTRLGPCLLVAAVMIPLVSLRQIHEASLRSIGRLFESQISTIIWPLALLLFAGLAQMTVDEHLSSTFAMVLHLAAILVASAMVYRFLARTQLNTQTLALDVRARGVWFKTAASFVLFESLIALKSRICIVMAARLLGSESAGLYATMDRFGEASTLGCQAVGFVIAPQLASLFASKRHAEMRQVQRQGSILCLLSTLPIALGILCLREWIFQILGASYRDGESLLFMLLASTCIIALSGPAAFVLQMTGHERSLVTITALCAATNIFCGFFLMNSMGIEGLGVSQILTSCVWTIGMRICLGRHPAWRSRRDDCELTQ